MGRILVTGGTGTTGRRIALQLLHAGHRALIASRTPKRPDQVLFDWSQPDTFSIFAGVDAIYVVAPSGISDIQPVMRPALDHALAVGVRRFVLLSAASLDEGGPMMGQTHAYLHEHAPEWCVLRPNWFMQNFSEGAHAATIRQDDTIWSAAGDGRLAFIDAEDIAAVAVHVLLDPNFVSGELLLTGPLSHSYDDVAMMLSRTLGRSIVHRRLTPAALEERLRSHGLDDEYARVLAQMDADVDVGLYARTTAAVERVVGRPPRDLLTFVDSHRSAWLR